MRPPCVLQVHGLPDELRRPRRCAALLKATTTMWPHSENVLFCAMRHHHVTNPTLMGAEEALRRNGDHCERRTPHCTAFWQRMENRTLLRVGSTLLTW